jgi:hypothetical protein
MNKDLKDIQRWRQLTERILNEELTDEVGIPGASDNEGDPEADGVLEDAGFWEELEMNGVQWGAKNVLNHVNTAQEAIDATQHRIQVIWMNAKDEEDIDDEFVEDANSQIALLKKFAKNIKKK